MNLWAGEKHFILLSTVAYLLLLPIISPSIVNNSTPRWKISQLSTSLSISNSNLLTINLAVWLNRESSWNILFFRKISTLCWRIRLLPCLRSWSKVKDSIWGDVRYWLLLSIWRIVLEPQKRSNLWVIGFLFRITAIADRMYFGIIDKVSRVERS